MNAVIGQTNAIAGCNFWLDHYRLLRLLKDGGMSRVYLAYDTYTHQQVAIKITERGQFNEKLFLREVRSMRRLNHPHILPLLSARRNSQWNYIVMPYIAGGTLQDRIDQRTLTFADISLILEQLVDALQYMHAHRIIHRDIKPNNILLHGNTVYLADFGIATWQKEEIRYLDEPIMGTPMYMAPEMYEGQISRQGDLYALGVVVYQMLTGNMPFDENASNLYWKQKTEYPMSPSLLNPQLSPTLAMVILRLLSREPEERFQTAAAFAAAYQKAIAPSLLERLTSAITNTVRGISSCRYDTSCQM